ncbi:recombinase family protein [Nocardia sp. CA-107356]|uniref:recombinase family protein n=1 Tax=Nocardia sp. CA-107356 TaxID=3239972 RepID=UPI003D9500AD
MIEPFLVGYVRCSTDEQDIEIQTEQLLALAVPRERIFIDKGFSGTTRRNRTGLDNAFTARSPSPRQRSRTGRWC